MHRQMDARPSQDYGVHTPGCNPNTGEEAQRVQGGACTARIAETRAARQAKQGNMWPATLNVSASRPHIFQCHSPSHLVTHAAVGLEGDVCPQLLEPFVGHHAILIPHLGPSNSQ